MLVLATGQAQPLGVATDGTNVYWANNAGGGGNGAVMSCPVCGCNQQPTPFSMSEQGATAIVTDGTNVYWTAQRLNQVRTCPVTGCPTTPATFAPAQSPLGLALDPKGASASARFLNWANNVVNNNNNGNVDWCSLAGCSGAPMFYSTGVGVASVPYGIASSGNDLYWSTLGGAGGIQHGYVRNCGGPGCGNVTNFGPGVATTPLGIVSDGLNVYWTSSDGVVRMCQLTGCVPSATLLATGQGTPMAITTDGTNVYWTTMGGAVAKCAVNSGGCGTTPTILISGQGALSGIAVDSASVYFATASGMIIKIAK
jgi:hypothetical protein